MPSIQLPDPQPNWAMFLDFDGCIVNIAPTPTSVKVPNELPGLLKRLREALSNSVAIITGRSIAQIDKFLVPSFAAVAGLHGFERRTVDGTLIRPTAPHKGIRNAKKQLEQFAENHEGVFVEDKEFALALHYRLNAELRDICRQTVFDAIADCGNEWEVIEGKCIFDIKPRSYDKGGAIETFMDEPPFAGRVPVFCGDDVTDEDGFVAVNSRGGVSIHVGDACNTAANWQVDSVDDLLVWLAHVASSLESRGSTDLRE